MEEAKLLNSIINTAIDGIITIDYRGVIETMNPAALKIFGYEEEEVHGKNISVLMPEPDKSVSWRPRRLFHSVFLNRLIFIDDCASRTHNKFQEDHMNR